MAFARLANRFVRPRHPVPSCTVLAPFAEWSSQSICTWSWSFVPGIEGPVWCSLWRRCSSPGGPGGKWPVGAVVAPAETAADATQYQVFPRVVLPYFSISDSHTVSILFYKTEAPKTSGLVAKRTHLPFPSVNHEFFVLSPGNKVLSWIKQENATHISVH